MAGGASGDAVADDRDAVKGVTDPTWAPDALARINAATGRAYRLGEHRPPPHPTRRQSGVWVVTDGDHRACLKWLPGDSDLAGQRAAAMTCDRLYAAGSPVPRYHFVDVIGGDGFVLMDFMPGHAVLGGRLTPGQAHHLVELIEFQAGAAVLPAGPPNVSPSLILGWASEWTRAHPGDAAELIDAVEAIARELGDVRLPSGDIVHSDMNPSNFIVDSEDGDRITGIVDWEITTTGDRAADVATILFYLWRGTTGEVLWEGLVALCTDETLRVHVLGLVLWALGSGKRDGASWLLDRISG